MMLRFDEKTLTAALERLPQPLRAAFAAACAERLMPAYDAFSRSSGRGDPIALREILSRLWDDLAGNAMTSAELKSRIDDCMKLIPREDEGVWIPQQAAAEDAAAAVAYALRCRQNGRSQEAAWSARRLYEAHDHYVVTNGNIDTNVAGAEALVLKHPLIQTELMRQQRDLDELSNVGSVANAVSTLRARAMTEGISFPWSV